MTRTRIGALALVVAVPFLASACGTSSTSQASNKPINLTWWVDQDLGLNQFYQQIAAQFEKKYPNVTIQIVETPDSSVAQKISVAANTGQLPDIEQGSFFWPLSYAYKNLLVPLNGIVDKSDLPPQVLQSVSVNNRIYIDPNAAVDIGLLVNENLFQDAGATHLLPTNMHPWSDSQLVQAAKAVTNPSKGIYGYGLYAGSTGGDQGTEAMLWGFGAKSFSANDQKAILNSPQGIKGLQFLIQLEHDGVTPPGAAALTATQEDDNLFLTGKLGLMFGNIINISIDEQAFKTGQAKPFKIGFIPYPTESGKGSNSALFGYGTWVWNTHNAQKIKWSEKFVKFFDDSEHLAQMAKYPAVVPTSKQLSNSYKPGSLKWDTIQLFQYAGNTGLAAPGYAATRNAFYPQIQAALLGKANAKTALDNWVTQANQIIQQNKGS